MILLFYKICLLNIEFSLNIKLFFSLLPATFLIFSFLPFLSYHCGSDSYKLFRLFYVCRSCLHNQGKFVRFALFKYSYRTNKMLSDIEMLVKDIVVCYQRLAICHPYQYWYTKRFYSCNLSYSASPC